MNAKKKGDLDIESRRALVELKKKNTALQSKNLELEENLRKFQEKIIELSEEKSNLTCELNQSKVMEDSLQKANDLLNKRYIL